MYRLESRNDEYDSLRIDKIVVEAVQQGKDQATGKGSMSMMEIWAVYFW